MAKSQVDRIKGLIATYYERLHQLELGQAERGNSGDVVLITAIDSIKLKIETLENELEMLENSLLGEEESIDNGSPSIRLSKLTHVFSGPCIIEIKIKSNISDFSEILDTESALIEKLAHLLECPPQMLETLSVRKGNIIFEIEMPLEIAERLISLDDANDSRLQAIGVEEINLIYIY